MVSISRKSAGVAVVAATAAAIGLGVSQGARADDTGATRTATPTPTATGTPGAPGTSGTPGPGWGPGGRHGGMGMGPGRMGFGVGLGMGPGADLATLATTLGVDETKLRHALTAVRDELRAARSSGQGGSTTRPDPATLQDQLATKLASKLGLDVAKVKAAFAQLRTAHEAAEQKALDDRLAAAVKAGTLTQAEADAVEKAVKAGVIDGHGAGPGRH